MTCRIDRLVIEAGVVLRISGRIAEDELDVVRAALRGGSVVALDLTDVELVDRAAVQFLSEVEASGIELRSCPTYIREWVAGERESH
jgi:hypothetical protein